MKFRSPSLSAVGAPSFTVRGADPGRAAASAAIEPLDAIALASVIGGLLLIPENLHHVHRFEVLANMVLAGHARGRGDVTRTRARRTIDEFVREWTGHNDDPWPSLGTEAFVHHGGTHLFIPGGIDTLFILRSLARAIERADHCTMLRERGSRIIQFACALSDDVLGCVGAQRNQRVPSPASIIVPPDGRLRQVRSAVLLGPDRLERLRSGSSVAVVDLRRFVAIIGSTPEPEPLESYC